MTGSTREAQVSAKSALRQSFPSFHRYVYKAFADLNNDGVIDEKDVVIVQQTMGQSLRPPRRAP
jgi:hypothetical protein